MTLLRPDEQIERLGSVGREWAGSGAIKLLDADGREVPDGEVGELYSRTAYVFDGYWKNPEKTAEAFRGAWCSVGDMARRDDEGYIHLVDRKSNMIISGGENIYPSEVEAVLGAHPAVQDVAVIGVPDDKWGESVLAVVVLRARGSRPPRPSCSTGAASAWPATSGRARSRSWRMPTCRAPPPERSCTARCGRSCRFPAQADSSQPVAIESIRGRSLSLNLDVTQPSSIVTCFDEIELSQFTKVRNGTRTRTLLCRPDQAGMAE